MKPVTEIDWQLVIVLAIIVIAAVWSVIGMIQHFRGKGTSCTSGCDGCPINSCSSDKRINRRDIISRK